MKKILSTLMLAALIMQAGSLSACAGNEKEEKEYKVLISTDMGDIVVKLYNETPLHRDNFLKLVRESFYDGTLFHRVIADFMIQGGDPDSRQAEAGAQLGEGDTGYTVPAEFRTPQLFHKRGALAAAREGDITNPQRASSGCQFYLVWGRTFDDQELDRYEQNIQGAEMQAVLYQLAEQKRDRIEQLYAAQDREGLMAVQDSLMKETEKKCSDSLFTFSPQMREHYKSVGGTPHLDSQYTVFGEIVEGLDVVDKIQQSATDENDRPLEDVRMSMKVLE